MIISNLTEVMIKHQLVQNSIIKIRWLKTTTEPIENIERREQDIIILILCFLWLCGSLTVEPNRAQKRLGFSDVSIDDGTQAIWGDIFCMESINNFIFFVIHFITFKPVIPPKFPGDTSVFNEARSFDNP